MADDDILSLELVPPWLQVLIGTAGTALLAAGAVAVFASTNELGTAAVLTTGAALVALGLFANNIRSIEGAGLALTIEAEKAERGGRPERARALRSQAQTLLAVSRPVARRFEDIRETQSSSWARTAELEQVVQQARDMAALAGSPDDVRALFLRGGDGDRLAAIGVMQANPKLADTELLAEAVRDSRSAFEQFHALRAVEGAAKAGLPTQGATLLKQAVTQAQTDRALGEGTDRGRLASKVLFLLSGPTAGH